MEQEKVNFLRSLWEKIKKQIKKTRITEGYDAYDDQNPPPTLPPYRYRTRQHHLTAHEQQHRAAEQSYWQEQLRLAKELNVLTGTLNYITGWATGIAGFTVCVGIAGLVGLYLTFKEAREANKIAWDALTDARETTKLDQRAWVGVVEATILPRQVETGPRVKADSPITFGAVITNRGKTPALKVKSTVAASFIPRREKFTPVYTAPPPGLLPSQGVLFPEILVDGSAAPMSLTQERIDAVRNETAIMYVFGKLEYQDIFRDFHCTTFCLRFAPDFSGAPACDTYNEVTDHKCEE